MSCFLVTKTHFWLAKNVFLVGKIFNAINNTKYTSFDNTTDLVALLKTQAIEGAFILIKGSRGMKLEQVVDCL